MPSRHALPDHDEQFIQQQLESGRYHDRNEVIHAGLEMLQEFESGLDNWIQNELPGRYAELQRDSSKAISLAEARAQFDRKYQDDLAKAK